MTDSAVWLILIGLCGALIIAGFLLYAKRMKEPIEFVLTERLLSAMYRDGSSVQITWGDVETVRVKRSWQFAVQVMEIAMNDKSKRIVCTNYLPKWGMFNETVLKYTAGRYKTDILQ